MPCCHIPSPMRANSLALGLRAISGTSLRNSPSDSSGSVNENASASSRPPMTASQRAGSLSSVFFWVVIVWPSLRMLAALYSIQRLCTPFDNIADALPRAKEVIADLFLHQHLLEDLVVDVHELDRIWGEPDLCRVGREEGKFA